jgi:hypothetical protein
MESPVSPTAGEMGADAGGASGWRAPAGRRSPRRPCR